MAWEEYDDLLDSERKKLENEISDAESSVREAEKNIENLQRVQLLLGGGEGRLGESDLERLIRGLLGVVVEINTQERRRRDEQLTLQRLLEGPQNIQGVVLSNGLALDGSFTFSELASAVADQEGDIEGIEPYGVDLTVGRIESLWEDVSDVDLADSRQQIEQYQQTLQQLRPIEEQLNQEDVGSQVAALGQLVPPDVISGLVPTAPAARDENVQAQLAAVSNYTPPAPATRDLGQATTQFQGPPSEFGTRQPTMSADEQRVAEGNRLFALNEMGYDLGPDKPEETAEPAINVADAKAMLEGLGFKITTADDGTSSGTRSGGTTGGGGVVATAAADMSEVQRLLIERFGGITFFLDKYDQQLQVGVTADGSPVPTDDPRATRVMNVVDMMVEYGIVDPNQVLKVVQQTTWYQTTDNAMRRHDALMANMTDLEKKEYFDPVLEQLKDEAVFLGVSLTDELAMQMANDILYLGEADDIDFIRQTLVGQGGYDLSVVESSSFAAITDSLVSLSKSYYTPIGTYDASTLAQDIYFGNQTPEGVEQMFKEQAAAKYPMLANALAANITPEQYFAPYKYELERILGRPNVDLYEEFPEVVSYMAENGEMRPMTLNEVRRFARGLPEWQESSQGIDAAYALTFAIGEVFGEVA
jgi:hypothetical protein